jgi:hypothetical protein
LSAEGAKIGVVYNRTEAYKKKGIAVGEVDG